MVWIIPILLVAFGAWRFYSLSRFGLLEMWLGLFIMMACIVLAAAFLTGALSCAAFC